MAEEKGAPHSAQTEESLENMQAIVNARQAETARLLQLTQRPLAAWLKRRSDQVRAASALTDNYNLDFSQAVDWETLTTALGQIFQSQRQLGHDTTQESKALLAFLWRATFEVRFDIGLRERERFIDLFGLRSPVTRKENESQIKHLNALQYRPMCVAESIMNGEIPFTRDRVIAHFVAKVIKCGYTNPDTGRCLDSADMCGILERHWDKFKNCRTDKNLMVAFTSLGYGLSPDQTIKMERARDEKAVSDAVDAAIEGAGHASIDGRGNLNDEKRQLAHAELDRRMAEKGFYPIRASKPLATALKVLATLEQAAIGKDKKRPSHALVSKVQLEQSITELQQQLQRLASVLVDKVGVETAGRFVESALAAHNMGIVEIRRNGKQVEIVPTPKADALPVAAD